MSKVVLETSRLSLREMTWDDLDFLASMLSDTQVMRHYPKTFTREEAAAWMQRVLERYANDGYGFWLVSDRTSGQSLGQVGLLRQVVEGIEESEIGYLIHATNW